MMPFLSSASFSQRDREYIFINNVARVGMDVKEKRALPEDMAPADHGRRASTGGPSA
jgi:hypothetical protein